jgi:hypothetical protein
MRSLLAGASPPERAIEIASTHSQHQHVAGLILGRLNRGTVMMLNGTS